MYKPCLTRALIAEVTQDDVACSTLIHESSAFKTSAMMWGDMKCASCNGVVTFVPAIASRAFTQQLQQQHPRCDLCMAGLGSHEFSLDAVDKAVAASIIRTDAPITVAMATTSLLVTSRETRKGLPAKALVDRFYQGMDFSVYCMSEARPFQVLTDENGRDYIDLQPEI